LQKSTSARWASPQKKLEPLASQKNIDKMGLKVQNLAHPLTLAVSMLQWVHNQKVMNDMPREGFFDWQEE
jgi:hypothetical protein